MAVLDSLGSSAEYGANYHIDDNVLKGVIFHIPSYSGEAA